MAKLRSTPDEQPLHGLNVRAAKKVAEAVSSRETPADPTSMPAREAWLRWMTRWMVLIAFVMLAAVTVPIATAKTISPTAKLVVGGIIGFGWSWLVVVVLRWWSVYLQATRQEAPVIEGLRTRLQTMSDERERLLTENNRLNRRLRQLERELESKAASDSDELQSGLLELRKHLGGPPEIP